MKLVGKAGFGEGEPQEDEPVGRALFFLVMVLLFALPLIAHVIAQTFGFTLFFLADQAIQLIWASLVLILGCWPLYIRAARALRVRSQPDLAAAAVLLASLGLYGYGLYLTVMPLTSGASWFDFEALAILMTGSSLLRLVMACAKRN